MERRSSWNGGLLFYFCSNGSICPTITLIQMHRWAWMDCPFSHSTASLLWATGKKRCRSLTLLCTIDKGSRPFKMLLNGLGEKNIAHDKTYMLKRRQRKDRTTPRLLHLFRALPALPFPASCIITVLLFTVARVFCDYRQC